MHAKKITYLKDVDYIYDDDDNLVAVWHTDSDIMIVQDESYTEDEIEEALGGATPLEVDDPETKARRVEIARRNLARLPGTD